MLYGVMRSIERRIFPQFFFNWNGLSAFRLFHFGNITYPKMFTALVIYSADMCQTNEALNFNTAESSTVDAFVKFKRFLRRQRTGKHCLNTQLQ